MADCHAEEHKIDFEEEDLTFISSEKYMERTSRAFAYFLKEPINVTYLENGNQKIIRGTMHLIEDADNFDRILIKSEETCKERTSGWSGRTGKRVYTIFRDVSCILKGFTYRNNYSCLERLLSFKGVFFFGWSK